MFELYRRRAGGFCGLVAAGGCFVLTVPPLTMFARVAAARALQAAPSAALPAARGFHASAAQAATLRELEQRIKSVSNIEKITKSMKMIASTQLNKAQRAMDAAKKYGEANQGEFCSATPVCLAA